MITAKILPFFSLLAIVFLESPQALFCFSFFPVLPLFAPPAVVILPPSQGFCFSFTVLSPFALPAVVILGLLCFSFSAIILKACSILTSLQSFRFSPYLLPWFSSHFKTSASAPQRQCLYDSTSFSDCGLVSNDKERVRNMLTYQVIWVVCPHGRVRKGLRFTDRRYGPLRCSILLESFFFAPHQYDAKERVIRFRIKK